MGLWPEILVDAAPLILAAMGELLLAHRVRSASSRGRSASSGGAS